MQTKAELRNTIEAQAEKITLLYNLLEQAEAQAFGYIQALAKRDTQTLSLQASLKQAQAEAEAYKELYRESQARKERALNVARKRKAEALSLCRKLAQAEATNEATNGELDEARRNIMDIAYFEAQADIVRKEKKEQIQRIIVKLSKRIEAQAETIRELRQELSDTKCKVLFESLPLDPKGVW